MTDQSSENLQDMTPQKAASLLQFYAQAGVVDLLDDDPIDRYADTIKQLEERKAKKAAQMDQMLSANKSRAENIRPQSSTPPQAQRPTPASTTLAVPDQAAMKETKELAQSAKTIEELGTIIKSYKGCNLCHSAKNTVFADGNPEAPVMLIGEAPGRDEDMHGIPFVGPAGQILDKMLAAISLDRTSCYISNIIPWRPPGNRTPVAHEIDLCRPFVERHIELAQPKLLIFMGNVSTKTLLNTNKGILSIRGKWDEYKIGEEAVPAMPTLHPAYLLKNPVAKRNAWHDLLAVQAKLKGLA
ncbi:MAG: uracil-DNA glycosylase [Lentilitoribacter sp.]